LALYGVAVAIREAMGPRLREVLAGASASFDIESAMPGGRVNA
jgi:hypothetical protein